jgi:glycosidase
MPRSLFDPEVQAVLDRAGAAAFPSPEDWRDVWIYFLMLDRFHHPGAPPRHAPFDDPGYYGFQGGKFAGVREALPYLKKLGAGALWLSPVLKNLRFDESAYHGYGIHDFLSAEPRFALSADRADEELRSLVDAAHEAGLYVIFDIVLNHTGDVFAYHAGGQVRWRDAAGAPRFASVENLPDAPRDALVWPVELQRDRFFRRQGPPRPGGDDTVGDFGPLKQMMTADEEFQRLLIRAYQYAIARFDPDGFRIDTLRYLKGGLARRFCDAMREFASRIGKKRFFTFGGRYTRQEGVDAVFDYGLFDRLRWVVKGMAPPSALVDVYRGRGHSEATREFVTFLDNHDVKQRLRYAPPGDEHRYDAQAILGLACLFTLPGIPCLYYGTEQGLHGSGSDPAVREALWGGPGLDTTSLFYREIARLAAIRKREAALRYGDFELCPVSGDGRHFGISPFPQGVIAFSRVLEGREIVVAANTHASEVVGLEVMGGAGPASACRLLYSNRSDAQAPALATAGPPARLRVRLQPLEAQIVSLAGEAR